MSESVSYFKEKTWGVREGALFSFCFYSDSDSIA